MTGSGLPPAEPLGAPAGKLQPVRSPRTRSHARAPGAWAGGAPPAGAGPEPPGGGRSVHRADQREGRTSCQEASGKRSIKARARVRGSKGLPNLWTVFLEPRAVQKPGAGPFLLGRCVPCPCRLGRAVVRTVTPPGWLLRAGCPGPAEPSRSRGCVQKTDIAIFNPCTCSRHASYSPVSLEASCSWNPASLPPARIVFR